MAHWDAVERSLRALLDLVPGYEVDSLSDETFVKDIAVAQLRVVPMGFYFADSHLVNPRFLVAAAHHA